MTEQPNSEILSALAALGVKYGAGVAGALLSLRFQPADATRGDKLWAIAGGLASVVWGVPALVELLEVTRPSAVALMGLVAGCIGMTVLSTLSASVRELGFAEILREAVRRIFRLDGKGRGGDQQ